MKLQFRFFTVKTEICCMIFRTATHSILEDLALFPVVAIIGPRQVGKTTLAKSLGQHLEKPTLYLDLESEDDLAKLANPETYLSRHFDKCVIIDEVQIVSLLTTLTLSPLSNLTAAAFCCCTAPRRR